MRVNQFNRWQLSGGDPEACSHSTGWGTGTEPGGYRWLPARPPDLSSVRADTTVDAQHLLVPPPAPSPACAAGGPDG